MNFLRASESIKENAENFNNYAACLSTSHMPQAVVVPEREFLPVEGLVVVPCSSPATMDESGVFKRPMAVKDKPKPSKDEVEDSDEALAIAIGKLAIEISDKAMLPAGTEEIDMTIHLQKPKNAKKLDKAAIAEILVKEVSKALEQPTLTDCTVKSFKGKRKSKGQKESVESEVTRISNFRLERMPLVSRQSAVGGNRIVSWTCEEINDTLLKMECMDPFCKRIPSPRHQFICSRGHFYCHDCGGKRISYSLSVCGHAMDRKVFKTGQKQGLGRVATHTDSQLAKGEIEKNKKTSECRLTLRSCQGDPIFCAVYNNTIWHCPNKPFGCQEQIAGKELVQHAKLCSKKRGLEYFWGGF
ncbi:hypothetical protein Ocin01_04764 [Orchesella cincta]|uniref:Uncharacterized protein n=1 Tax=Orchesella cincta TaxID=48709 RepID=A0A1D2N9K0_ORCCI|nr:hypothetical protein Ocin01_04764 [Orchesella cincta]